MRYPAPADLRRHAGPRGVGALAGLDLSPPVEFPGIGIIAPQLTGVSLTGPAVQRLGFLGGFRCSQAATCSPARRSPPPPSSSGAPASRPRSSPALGRPDRPQAHSGGTPRRCRSINKRARASVDVDFDRRHLLQSQLCGRRAITRLLGQGSRIHFKRLRNRPKSEPLPDSSAAWRRRSEDDHLSARRGDQSLLTSRPSSAGYGNAVLRQAPSRKGCCGYWGGCGNLPWPGPAGTVSGLRRRFHGVLLLASSELLRLQKNQLHFKNRFR